MSLDPTWLFVSLFPSGIGFVLFVYGKKQGRGLYMIGGLLFMLYPYFATSLTALIAVGVGLASAIWIAARGGW